MEDTVTVEINIPTHGKDFVFTTESLNYLYPSPSQYYICSCGTLQRSFFGKREDLPDFNGIVKLKVIGDYFLYAHFKHSKLTAIIMK